MTYPRSFSHIGISVTDLNRAVDFYTTTLGWHVTMPTAYVLKEDLRQIWEQANQREARKFLLDWWARANASGIKVLMAMVKTISTLGEGIIARYDYPILTGPFEGINSKIETMKRQATDSVKWSILVLRYAPFTSQNLHSSVNRTNAAAHRI